MKSALDSIYKPIDWKPIQHPQSFRLLSLAGKTKGDGLRCELKQVTFEQVEGHYIAISYTWGGQDLTETIVCNGQTVRITKNLGSALSRLRQPELPFDIWCDALCIKQGRDPESLLERSQQIPLMGRIFSGALRVVIDLGDDDGSLSQALEGINAILRTPNHLRARCHLEPEPLEYLKLPRFTDPMWAALGKLLSRPWFQRIWCVQEAVLARDIRVIFGPHAITIDQLVPVATVFLYVSFAAGRTYQTMTWKV